MSSTKAKTWVACNPSKTGELIHLSPDEVKPGMEAAPLGLEQYLTCVEDATPKYAPIRHMDGTCKCYHVPVGLRGALGGGLTKKQCFGACATPDNPTAMYTCSEGGTCDPSPGMCGNTSAEGEAMGCFPTKEACQRAPGFCHRKPEGPRVWAQLPVILQSQMDISDPRLCKPFHEKSLRQELNQALDMYNAMNAQKDPSFTPVTLTHRNCKDVTADNPLKENEWCTFPPHTPRHKVPHISMEVGDSTHTKQCTPGYCVPVAQGVWGNPSVESNPAGEFYGRECGAPRGHKCPGGVRCVGGYCNQFGDCVITPPPGQKCGDTFCDDARDQCIKIHDKSTGTVTHKCVDPHANQVRCGNTYCDKHEKCAGPPTNPSCVPRQGPHRSGSGSFGIPSPYAMQSPYAYAGYGLDAPVAGMGSHVGSNLYFTNDDVIY